MNAHDVMGTESCRNQGTALAERACGYCHEGDCPWERVVIIKRSDFEAIDEEWAISDDPFWRPVTLAAVLGRTPEGTEG